jgi:hypothetical protein
MEAVALSNNAQAGQSEFIDRIVGSGITLGALRRNFAKF